MSFNTVVAASLVVVTIGCGTALAAEPAGHSHDHDAAKPVAASAEGPATEGEIRKVDIAARKLTVKHGPIENLGMPGMTMAFNVADPEILAAVQPGDHVRMRVERIGGFLTIVSLRRIP